MKKYYNPVFYQNSKDFLAANSTALKSLFNKKIQSYYVLWDIEDDVRWVTHPIILVIDNVQYEFLFDNFSDFSMTINQINKEKCNWYEEDEIELVWKTNCYPDLDKVLNKPIQEINLIEMVLLKMVAKNDQGEFVETGMDSRLSLAGIEFKFENRQSLTIYNSLNENSITLENIEKDYSQVRRVKV
ncbi:MAG: hypothetical protein WBP45_14170 [Daejeonella sp.]